MKKLLALLPALAMTFALCACSSGPNAAASASPTPGADSEPVELVVFAAASMTETMNRIAALYKDVAPNVTLVYNFDSSGTLKTQIQEGADCDLFISAAQKQMDQLDAAAGADANPDGLDFVRSDTRVNLVENKVVLVVSKDSATGVTSFDDVVTDKVSLIALGNSDVPAGQYAEEVFTHLGLWDKLNSEHKITFGSNVKEVAAQVAEGAADCGVVYGSDVTATAGLRIAAYAPEGSYQPAVYPAAVLKNAKHPDAAKAFLAYLLTDDCAAVFESAGLSIPER